MDLAAERCFLFRARALARKPASFLAHFFSAAAALPLAAEAAAACLVDLSLTTALTRPLWSLPVLASAALWAALSALFAAACLALTSLKLDFWRSSEVVERVVSKASSGTSSTVSYISAEAATKSKAAKKMPTVRILRVLFIL